MIVEIMVPKSDALLRMIAPKSGIVGIDAMDVFKHIYFEGNLYDASNMRLYTERLKVAAGRLRDRYPTVAQMMVDADDVIVVGSFNTDGWTIEAVTDPKALEAWAGPEALDIEA